MKKTILKAIEIAKDKDYYGLILAAIQKWLRDKHKIHIMIDYMELSEKWTAGPVFYLEDELSLNNTMEPVVGKTYEEVLEKAIQKALNNINYG